MRIARGAARLCAAMAVGLTVAACQNGDGQTGSAQTVTVQNPDPSTQSTQDSGQPAGATGGLPNSWPDKEFPLPPAVTVVEANNAGGTGIVLTGVAAEEVVEFYRDALPAAGYKITKDKSVGVGGIGITGMEFTGHGYHGELAVLGSGSSGVAISLDNQ